MANTDLHVKLFIFSAAVLSLSICHQAATGEAIVVDRNVSPIFGKQLTWGHLRLSAAHHCCRPLAQTDPHYSDYLLKENTQLIKKMIQNSKASLL